SDVTTISSPLVILFRMRIHRDSEHSSSPLRSPGQYADKETNLHYNYFRDYDAVVGRFIQADPLGLADGPQLYGYAHADPLLKFDPTGTMVPIPFRLCNTMGEIQDKCIYNCPTGPRTPGEQRCIQRPLVNTGASCGFRPCQRVVLRMFTTECPQPLRPNLPPGILP